MVLKDVHIGHRQKRKIKLYKPDYCSNREKIYDSEDDVFNLSSPPDILGRHGRYIWAKKYEYFMACLSFPLKLDTLLPESRVIE